MARHSLYLPTEKTPSIISHAVYFKIRKTIDTTKKETI